MKEVFIVVEYSFPSGQLSVWNAAAYTTREAAEDHIEKMGNKVLEDRGGMSKYGIRPIALFDTHDQWVEYFVARAMEIMQEWREDRKEENG